ncbi:MAG: GGDEF domain-containing protein [Firmicutes bacterium]|nr:GGDEF domain-containing protein [Bacillota bacterium]
MEVFTKVVFDMMFCVKTANAEFFDIFGSKIQRSFFAYLHEDDLPRLQSAVEQLPETLHDSGAVRLRNKNDEYRLYYIKLDFVKGEKEDLIDAYMIDIEDMRDMYNKQVEREQLACRHLNNMELLCFEYSPATKKISIFAHSLNQTLNLYNGDFFDWREKVKAEQRLPEDQTDTFDALCFDIESCKESFTYRMTSAVFTQGENIEENIIRCATTVTELGNTYVVGTVASVVNNATLGVENTYVRTYKDAMTGVLNKASIIRLIKMRMANIAPGESIVIAILDLDNFKLVNDTFGHLYGDKIIIRFANIISKCIGNRGILGRFGGDEFMILLENIKDEMDLRSVLRSIRTSVEMEFKDIGEDISLTTSIGAATYPKDAKDYDELFTKTDYCLYLSKMRGKNRYVMFDYMIKEHHYIADKLMLKKDHATIDRFAFASNIIEQLVKKRPIPMMDVLAAIGERYELDRIRIYVGSDLELKYNWGVPTNEKNFVCIYEDRYLDEFGDAKNFVINYTSNIEVTHPQIYESLQKSGTQAAVQYLIGNKQHVEGLVSFEMTQKGNHWTDDFIYTVTLVGYLLEATAFNTAD